MERNEFDCLHRTEQGRIYFCPEYRRFVVDFRGHYFVFHEREFMRVQRYFSSIVGCPFSRKSLEAGERIHIRDAAGRNSVVLDLDGLDELVELMEAATFQPGSGKDLT
jgi:hypothetical protein